MKQWIHELGHYFPAAVLAGMICISTSGCGRQPTAQEAQPANQQAPISPEKAKMRAVLEKAEGGKVLNGDELVEMVRVWATVTRARHNAEKEDRRLGDLWSQARDEVEKKGEVFSACYKAVDAAIEKACAASGAPAADFAPVKTAQNNMKAAEAALEEASAKSQAAKTTFDTARKIWFELMDGQSVAGGLVSEQVGKSIGEKWKGSRKIQFARLKYEKRYVDELVKNNANNHELASAAEAYYKALGALEAEHNSYVESPAGTYSQLQDLTKRITEVLAKPTGPETTAQLTALREEGRQLHQRQAQEAVQQTKHNQCEERIKETSNAYADALEKVVLAVK